MEAQGKMNEHYNKATFNTRSVKKLKSWQDTDKKV